MKRRSNKKLHYRAIAIEIILVGMAVLSLVLLGFEIFGHPSDSQRLVIAVIDSYIGALYLLEFILRLFRSGQPKKYFRKNWYLLLAAIPVSSGLTQFLRIVRLEGVLRLMRVYDHFSYEKNQSK